MKRYRIGFYRAVLWDLILSPAHPDLRLIMIPHFLALLLEGQAKLDVRLVSLIIK